MKQKSKWIIALVLIVLLGIMIFAIVQSNKANEVTITFDCHGGTKIESQDIKKGNKLEEPEEPERKGYEFIGWYYDGKKFDFDQEITEDIELEAKWIKVSSIKYTVKFDSNGGSSVEEQKIKNGDKVEEPSNPTRNGYTFLGWQLDGKNYDFNSKVEKNITLVAVWSKNEVSTVPYGPVQQTIVTVERPTTTVTPTKPKPAKPEQKPEPVEPELKMYKVTFRYSENMFGATMVPEGETISRPRDPEVVAGYEFLGWYYNGEIFDFSTPIYEDMELIAYVVLIDESTAYVKSEQELKDALLDEEVTNIHLIRDLEIQNTIEVNRSVNIYGHGAVIEVTNPDVESAIVIKQNQTAHIYDYLSVTGAQKGIVVEGTLEIGDVVELGDHFLNVSGNSVVGIEVADTGKLLTGTSNVSMQEDWRTPTVWTKNGTVNIANANIQTVGDKTYYFTSSQDITKADIADVESLKTVLSDAYSYVTTINLMQNIVSNETLVMNRAITMNANGYEIKFQNVSSVAPEKAAGLVVQANGVAINDLRIYVEQDNLYGIKVSNANIAMKNYIEYGGLSGLLLDNNSNVNLQKALFQSNENAAITVMGNSTLVITAPIEMFGNNEAMDCPTILQINGAENAIVNNTEIPFYSKRVEKDGEATTYYYLNEQYLEQLIESLETSENTPQITSFVISEAVEVPQVTESEVIVEETEVKVVEETTESESTEAESTGNIVEAEEVETKEDEIVSTESEEVKEDEIVSIESEIVEAKEEQITSTEEQKIENEIVAE